MADMDPDAIIQEREELLERQKDLFKTASSRRGQRAQNRPTRAQLEAFFTPSYAAAMEADLEASKRLNKVRQTVVGYSYPPCTMTLTDLDPMTIDELRLEENHTGRVLFARTFGTPYRLQAAQSAISDTLGDVDRVAIYNFEPDLAPTMVLPINSLIAIKQPYYKLTVDGSATIRVDHPSDLVLLSGHDERAPAALRSTPSRSYVAQGALSWKASGNQAFKNKQYHTAAELYTQGLETCQDDDKTNVRFDLYRNRAITNINLHRYEAGLADAEASVMPGDRPKAVENNTKAYYRAGCAAYQLGDFAKAESSFTNVLKVTPSDHDAIRELKRTQHRQNEQSTGRYCFEMMADSVSAQHTRLDHADFTAKVQPRSSKIGGNGLFATAAINAGELVLCEKAFAVAFEKDEGTTITAIINLNRDSGSIGTHTTRLVATIHKMLHGPKQADKFLKLYDGGYLPKATSKLVDGTVPVDTFQVQAALELNGFACPSLSTALQEATDSPMGCGSTGAWLTASFINHDCSGNAQRAFIGDMMIVHATRDIAKDEEIFMRYRNPDDDNAEFQTSLKKSWDFTCKCRLCTAESATPDPLRRVRVAMLKQAKAFMKRNPISQLNPPKAGIIAKAEKLRAQVASSYDSIVFRSLPRLGLHDLDHWLCMAYILSGAEDRVREAGFAVLRDQGIELTIKKDKISVVRPFCRPDVTAIHATTYIAAGYFQKGNDKVGDQLEAFAKELHRIGYGTMRGYHSSSRSV